MARDADITTSLGSAAVHGEPRTLRSDSASVRFSSFAADRMSKQQDEATPYETTD